MPSSAISSLRKGPFDVENGELTASAQEERSLNAQLEVWKLEQEVVASLVRVESDPSINTSVIENNPIFQFICDDEQECFSLSDQPDLYGGVDVSFPIVEGNESQPKDNKSNEKGIKGDMKNEAVAVYVIIDRRTLQVIYHDHIFFQLNVPYIPSYLAFREIDPLEQLVKRQIERRPDVTPKAILVDGNGILHPRQAGLACFLGTRTDIPTIGIGKTLFCEGGWTREALDQSVDTFLQHVHGGIMRSPYSLASSLEQHCGLIVQKKTNESIIMAKDRGDDSTWNRKIALEDLAPFCIGFAIPLEDRLKAEVNSESLTSSTVPRKKNLRFPILGCALVGHGGKIAASSRTKAKGGTSKPIFVSVGHKISLQKAALVTASLSLARIPEPIRQADLYGRQLMREKASIPGVQNSFACYGKSGKR